MADAYLDTGKEVRRKPLAGAGDRTSHPAKHAMRYCPDIDGLRAVAVLAVLFYHLGLTEFPGGFVGVDIFFVISGYLITSSILVDARGPGFSFLAFYDRRIRRIFPALIAMAAVVTLAVAILLPPAALSDYGDSLAAMGGFVSNFYLDDIGSVGGYFAKASEDNFLLHTWSLSVEEQFYLFMPALLVLLGRKSDAFKLKCLAILAAASFVYSVVAIDLNPVDAFYSVLSRTWELLLGSLLAFGTFGHDLPRWAREALSLLGLGMIGYAIVFFGKETSFPGADALFPCVGAFLLIATGRAGDTMVKRLLSTRPLVAVGLVSYSLYLWHWPLIAGARYLTVGHLDLPIRIGIIAASLGAAYASLVLVERPFRRGFRLAPRRTVVAVGIAASAAVACVGAAAAVTGGLPQRFDAHDRALIAANAGRQDEHPLAKCENFQKDVHSIRDILFCPIGNEPRHVMFWGDSHAHLLEPAVRALYDEGRLHGRSAIFAIAAACPPVPTLERTAKGFHCAAFARLALERALQSDVDTVFIGFAALFDINDFSTCRLEGASCGAPLTRAQADDLFIAKLRDTIVALKAHGKTVVVALPAPFYSDEIPDLLMRKIALGRLAPFFDLESRLRRTDFDSVRERVKAVARDLDARIFDPREALCPGGKCIYARDGVSIYADGNHVATSQVAMFRPQLVEALDAKDVGAQARVDVPAAYRASTASRDSAVQSAGIQQARSLLP